MKRAIVILLIFNMFESVLGGCKQENVIEAEFPGEVYTPGTYEPSEIDPPDISE